MLQNKILVLEYTFVSTTNYMLLIKYFFMEYIHENIQNGHQNA